MPILRPALRFCQAGSTGCTAAPLRCQISASLPWRTRWHQFRTQHDNYGPHKEYFQIPGKEPKPDLTPYVRDVPMSSTSQWPLSQPSFSSSKLSPNPYTTPEQPSQPQRGRWLRIPRFIRSVTWFLLFAQLGVAAGTGFVTWEYLSPPFEPGSEEEQELIEDILEVLDMHPMTQELREDEWVEVEAFAPDLQHGIKGRHLVHQVLGANNTQGIFVKVFHHPTQEFTMLVFFFGFGVEGWPDVVHGGAIATMLQEGLSKHLSYFYPGYFITPDFKTKIDYKKPCQPGNVYGVLVAPSGRKATTAGNVHVTELQMTSLLVQIGGAPAVSTEFDVLSNTETHTVGIPARKGEQPAHAVCQAEVKIVPRQIHPSGQTFEVGGKDDGGFARALEVLKARPEFKSSAPPPPPSSTDSEDDGDS